MFIKVTSEYGLQMLLNTDHLYCVIGGRDKCRIVYTDNTELMVKENLFEIERMMKGAEDERQ